MAELLPVLTAAVESGKDWLACHEAMELAAVMGPAAAPLAPALRPRLDAPQDNARAAARAALALRAITGDHGPDANAADAALLAAWAATRSVRSLIAAGLHREDPAVPLPAGLPDLLREELSDTRRLDNSPRPTRERFRHNTAADEAFRGHAADLLARA